MLVVLYRQQKNLKKSELNWEVREQHTEELRKRVRYWLGMEHKQDSYIAQFGDESYLPKVEDGKLLSAEESKPNAYQTDTSNSDFYVYPTELDGDRYLIDFLENHAPEIASKCEEIQSAKTHLDELENEFVEEIGEVKITFQSFPHLDEITMTADYKRDLFERLVFAKRDTEYTEERIKRESVASIDGLELSQSFVGTTAPGHTRFSFSTSESNLSNTGPHNMVSNPQGLKQEVKSTLDEILEDDEYEFAREKTEAGAQVLEDAEKVIENLENELVAYEGKPIYQGNCGFIESVGMKAD